MSDGYVIYHPGEPLDAIFFRSALSTVMMVSEAVKRDYGKWAERIVFRGETAKRIFDNFTMKNYNLGATMAYEQSPDDEIVLELHKKVRVVRGDVIREIGFEYKIEKEVLPQITITIIKLF
jgi:acetyl-CoA acetyltransferase